MLGGYFNLVHHFLFRRCREYLRLLNLLVHTFLRPKNVKLNFKVTSQIWLYLEGKFQDWVQHSCKDPEVQHIPLTSMYFWSNSLCWVIFVPLVSLKGWRLISSFSYCGLLEPWVFVSLMHDAGDCHQSLDICSTGSVGIQFCRLIFEKIHTWI